MAGQFLTVTCRDCGTETVIFDRSVNTISCDVCGATLSRPLAERRTSWAAASLRPMSEEDPHMARITATDGPQEGDLVVATVTTVKQNGCYVSLDEFDGREGFIFIGEIASGWVRNIRAFVREGQRLICKITGMRRDGTPTNCRSNRCPRSDDATAFSSGRTSSAPPSSSACSANKWDGMRSKRRRFARN